MKRTNLVLNEETLETATRLMGAKTYSEAVNRALQQAIQLIKIRGLVEVMGTGVWEGDLAEMRQSPRKTSTRKKRGSPR